MNGHLLTLLLLIATQCGPIFADSSTPLGTKLLAMLGTVLTVVIADTQKRTAVVNVIVGVSGVAVPVLLFALAKMHPGTLAVEVLTAIVGVFVRLRGLKSVPSLQSLALAFLVVGTVPACHNIPPDQFARATVDCAKINPQASAALASVQSCLLGVVMQNPGVCLSGLVTEGHFAIDEVACLVSFISQQGNGKVAAGTADGPTLVMRREANAWLTAEKIQIVNSYPPGN